VPNHADKRTLVFLAWLNVALHGLALLLAGMGMRPGSPLVTLPERVHYLASYPFGWSLGWVTWMLCTLALIAFFAAMTHYLQNRPSLSRLAVIIVAAGGMIDLFCDVLYITVLPLLAAQTPVPEATFLAVERAANAGGLIVANGAYATGVLLLTACLPRVGESGRWVILIGYAVFGFGTILVVAGFLGEPWLAAIGTGPTIVLYCLWTVLVARFLRSAECRP
jgi:hypothetical protein